MIIGSLLLPYMLYMNIMLHVYFQLQIKLIIKAGLKQVIQICNFF